jgi:hypothetical protein
VFFYPFPLYIVLLWLVWMVWRGHRGLDRSDFLLGYEMTLFAAWLLEFFSYLASPVNVQLLLQISLICAVLAVVGTVVYRCWPVSETKILSILRPVYEKWLQAHIWEGDLKTGIGISIYAPDEPEGTTMTVNKLDGFERAETYLKEKHKKVYSDWIEANVLVAKYNELSPKRLELMIELLRSQMRTAYPTLTEATSSTENNYYYFPLLISAFLSNIEPDSDEWKVRLYPYEHTKEEGRPSTLKSNGQTLISSDNISDVQLQKLQRTFDAVKLDSQFKRMSDDLLDFRTQAKARLKDFVTKLRKLCEKAEAAI